MRKKIEIAVAVGLVFAVLLSLTRFNAACEDLRSHVLRLHILANSDSAADQAVKLLVRDGLLTEGTAVFADCTTLSQAERAAGFALADFESAANEVLAQNGMDYQATVDLETAYFETRVYDDFTLPAGYYQSLVIRLGKAKGHNWWCVIFPAVCVPTASASLQDAASAYSAATAEHSERYKMQFWLIDRYEKIKNFLKR